MKKIALMFLCVSLCGGAASASGYYKTQINTCDESEMRAALDRATAEKRAVITIVECDNGIVRTRTVQNDAKPSCGCNTCGKCGEMKEEVIKREYFVRETVQKYKPVVQYVPAGTYTRVKPACDKGC